jgi:hypothetical protein
MKKIEDYLQFHIGCEYVSEIKGIPNGTIAGVSKDECCDFVDLRFIDPEEGKEITIPTNYFDQIKLLLRPLSGILNTEAYEVYKIYFGKETALDFSGDNGSVYYNPKQVRVKAEHALRIFDGQDYETGDFAKVLELVPYLLSKHFDLFGLIEAGLAIDSTAQASVASKAAQSSQR